MAMRLLSPSQGKSRGEIGIAEQERRLVELDGIIRDKRLALQKLEAQELRTLSVLGKERYEEETLWKEKIEQLTTEVEGLESRRKTALVPLETLRKELQDRDSALLKREEQVTLKESDLEYTKQTLEEKLDAVSEREQDASDYAVKLNNREFNIQFKEKEIQTRMDSLVTILQEAFEDMTRAQSEAAQQKAILKGREVPLLEREKNVEMAEKSFANRERAILDKYRTLQRAITETNLKK